MNDRARGFADADWLPNGQCESLTIPLAKGSIELRVGPSGQRHWISSVTWREQGGSTVILATAHTTAPEGSDRLTSCRMAKDRAGETADALLSFAERYAVARTEHAGTEHAGDDMIAGFD